MDVLIKWTGSKRLQAPKIVPYYPRKIKTYYEPFLGGGSMLYTLLASDIEVEHVVASDINVQLIGIWQLMQADPLKLADDYEARWNKLKTDGKSYYVQVRNEFNSDRDPAKFFFLLRTCRNGLVRFNKKQHFNSAYHFGRNGILPDSMREIIFDWHEKTKKVKFSVQNYLDVKSEPGDFIYLDPPYATHNGFLMYYGMIDYDAFWQWLRSQPAAYLISLNGFKDEQDCTLDVPKDVYERHELIDNGLNKFDQLCKKRVRAYDSLYIKGV
jgi:DNA adenine methylase